MSIDTSARTIVVKPLAAGDGWRLRDVRCSYGRRDRSADEQHEAVAVAVVLSGTFTYQSTYGREFMTPGSLLLGNRGACFRCRHEQGGGDRRSAFLYEPEFVEEVPADATHVGRTEFRHHRIPPVGATVPLVSRTRLLANLTIPM